MKLKLADFDECKCGDYRRDHKDGVGACLHNKPRDLTHGYKDCHEFRLDRAATEIPEPFAGRAALTETNRRGIPTHGGRG